MAITMVPIRAVIVLSGQSPTSGNPSYGNANYSGSSGLTAVTPPLDPDGNHILSFNVDKARGQISSFSASLKVLHSNVTSSAILGDTITISAGTSTVRNTIFTGIVRKATITPCRDDPAYVILNLSGNDVMSRLEGKKFTRRCRYHKSVWVGIEGITRPGLRSGKLAYTVKDTTIETWGGDVEKKDNVTSTRALNVPETVSSPPKGEIEKEVTLSVQSVESPNNIGEDDET